MQEATASVLVLRISDFRNSVYAVFRDQRGGAAAAAQRLHYFINDHHSHVAAGNMALLYLLPNDNTDAGALFHIWFSLPLSTLSDAALRAVLRALSGPGADAALWRRDVSLNEAQIIPLLRSIGCAWLTWMLYWDFIRAASGKVLEARFEKRLTARAACFEARVFHTTCFMTPAFPSTRPGLSLRTIFRQYR